MRTPSWTRRAGYALLGTGLLAAGIVPLSASAASCPTWTDEAGDATTGQSGVGPLADAQMDIVSAAFGTVGKDLVGTITTDGLGASSSDAGDEFAFRFTIAEQDVLFYVDRTAPLGEEVDVTAGFYNFTTDATGEATAEFDVEAKTVRLVGPLDQLEAAVGKPVAKLQVTDLVARTSNQLLFGAIAPAPYDDAASPAKPVIGTQCTIKGGSAPKPAPTAAASPSGSASAAPSPSAATSPSASASPSASPSPSPSPTVEPPPQPAVPVPAPGCVGFSDDEGDSDAAVGPAGSGDDPDLDLLSVTGRTTSKAVAGHLGVAALSSGPSMPTFTGHRFEYEFFVGEKAVVLSAEETGAVTVTVDGAEVEGLTGNAVFDEPSSQVVLEVDRAALAKATGDSLHDGVLLTGLAGRSYALTPVSATVADTASAPDAVRGSYSLGDNTCFAPALAVTAPGSVQTTDVAVLNVSVATSDGRVAAGQAVTARVGGGRSVSARTDRQGLTTLRVPVSDAAGVRDVVVRTNGPAGDGEWRGTLQVLVERAVLGLRSSGSGSNRSVTATLTDDDRRALGGQRVTFAFGGRTVTATTDGSGRASVTVPRGTAVEASFAGRSGRLSSARSRTTA